MTKLLPLTMTFLLLLSCGGKEEEDQASSGGSEGTSVSGVQIKLESGEVSTFAAFKPLSSVCSLSIGAVTHNGTCYTPTSMKAKVSQINLSNSYGGPPARLIDFSATPEDEPTNGPHGILGLSTYDFAAAAENTNPYSDDNLQDSSTNYYNNITLQTGAIELKLEIPAGNGNVTNKFWTIRYMLQDQNPLDDSTIDSCVTSPSIRTALQNSGDLYSAPSGFQQGDILLCKKALTTDVCADSDFEWVNSGNGAVSSTRPASPVKLSGTYMFQGDSCESGGGNLKVGGANFKTKLTSAIRLNKSRSAESCLYKYSFQTTCSTTGLEAGSCSDSVQEGFGTTVSVDFDLTDSVFVPNTVDLTSDTEAGIQQNLYDILPKPLYVENNKAAVGTGDDTDLDSTLTIAIDNTIATAALQTRGEDPDEYDDDFCFIPQEKPRRIGTKLPDFAK